MDDACTLISRTCTTGWLDWIHGDLWLCPDGLLRVSLGLRATLVASAASGTRDSVNRANRPTHAFGADEVARLAAADKRNWWITWDQVTRATLRGAMLSNVLEIELADGRTAKLDWLKQDGGMDVLEPVLRSRLGDRFEPGRTRARAG